MGSISFWDAFGDKFGDGRGAAPANSVKQNKSGVAFKMSRPRIGLWAYEDATMENPDVGLKYIFKKMIAAKVKSNEKLKKSFIMPVSGRDLLSNEECKIGLDHGIKNGFFEDHGASGLLLTELGYAEMEKYKKN